MDKGGLTMGAFGVGSWLVDKLNIMTVNDVLTGVSLLVGIIWVCFKIRNEIITYKLNKKKLDE